MKQLVILSGKGGTGKTTIAGALAHLWPSRAVFVDADVDASNLHLLSSPETLLQRDFVGGKLATVDDSACTRCGACTELCRFGAILDGAVSRVACEGCGLCARACPEQAVSMVERTSGKWFVSHTRYGLLVHAELHPGEGNSGKLVGFLKEQAGQLARDEGHTRIVCDGPPGIGCPAMASLAGADLVLAVAEPSTSSLHDLERVLSLTRHFDVPATVALNRADVVPGFAHKVADVAADWNAPVVAEVPYDPALPSAAAAGLPFPVQQESTSSAAIRALAEKLEYFMDGTPGLDPGYLTKHRETGPDPAVSISPGGKEHANEIHGLRPE